MSQIIFFDSTNWFYNSSLSKLLNSILYRILLFLCCSDIIQIGRANYHMQQQRRISLSASLWLKLYWITTVDFQQWWRKEGSKNSFAVKLLLVIVSTCISNSILLAAGLYYACFAYTEYYLIVQTEITCVHQSCGESKWLSLRNTAQLDTSRRTAFASKMTYSSRYEHLACFFSALLMARDASGGWKEVVLS